MLFEKKKLMFICQKLDARFFFIKLVLKCFQNYFIRRVIYSNRIKNKQDTASKVFRQSPCINVKFNSKPTRYTRSCFKQFRLLIAFVNKLVY
jgi:hypothetical protein